MSPAPESELASRMIDDGSTYNSDRGILYASRNNEIAFSNAREVPIQPQYGKGITAIPCRGVLSIPVVTSGNQEFYATALSERAPASREALVRFGDAEKMLEVYGVRMVNEENKLTMSAEGARTDLEILTSGSNYYDYYERYIASAVAVAPIDTWETIRESGLVVIRDPVGYTGEPFIDLVAIPDRLQQGMLRKIERADYVSNEMWQSLGDPFVIRLMC